MPTRSTLDSGWRSFKFLLSDSLQIQNSSPCLQTVECTPNSVRKCTARVSLLEFLMLESHCFQCKHSWASLGMPTANGNHCRRQLILLAISACITLRCGSFMASLRYAFSITMRNRMDRNEQSNERLAGSLAVWLTPWAVYCNLPS